MKGIFYTGPDPKVVKNSVETLIEHFKQQNEILRVAFTSVLLVSAETKITAIKENLGEPDSKTP